MLNKYVIIDKMENEIYYFNDEIDMGFSLDNIVDYRDRINIDYHYRYYNFGKVIVIY